MDATKYNAYTSILRSELICALGCTEPIAVAYAASLAKAALGQMPSHITVYCSGNIIKNVKAVTVPNSEGMKGIEAAASLGCIAGDYRQKLEVLQSVGPADIRAAKQMLDQGFCSIELAENVPNLYISCAADSDKHQAVATIQVQHTNVCQLEKDGKPISLPGLSLTSTPEMTDAAEEEQQDEDLRELLDLESIWEYIHCVDIDDIAKSVTNQIETNSRIAESGLSQSWGACVGKTLMSSRKDSISTKAKAMAAAASDARMSGCPLPVVIVCGSGNQGITTSLPVVQYARDLGVDLDTCIRAVALSDLIAIHVKYYIGELSAFCGAVSAACGAGTGICYLKGGTFKQMEATIVNTLANVGGIVCDGAKPSCAAKIASSVDAAILGCDMALNNESFSPGEGLVGTNAEQTIRSMGYLGRVGMSPTDKEILKIMIGKVDTNKC